MQRVDVLSVAFILMVIVLVFVSFKIFLRWYILIPVYLLYVDDTITRATKSDLDELAKNIDKYVKVRDDLVGRIEKAMLFLATVLILIFFVLLRIIDVPKMLNIEFTNNRRQVYFVFTFLLIGNIVALLYSTAMLKMFMMESLIDRFSSIYYTPTYKSLNEILLRFFTFTYELISEQASGFVPRSVRRVSRILHYFTTFLIPTGYMAFYIFVLWIGLSYIADTQSNHNVRSTHWPVIKDIKLLEMADSSKPANDEISKEERKILFWALVGFNAVTLPIYAFTFLPVPVRRLSENEFFEKVKKRANEIWEEEGCPEGRAAEHWSKAEQEVRLRMANRLPYKA
jgi:hypothetical protein